jgi:hypothetical protein
MILEQYPELTTLDGGSFRETECVKQKKNWMTKGRFLVLISSPGLVHAHARHTIYHQGTSENL